MKDPPLAKPNNVSTTRQDFASSAKIVETYTLVTSARQTRIAEEL